MSLLSNVLYQRMVGQVVLGSFESFNLYALNQAHSAHHAVHATYRHTSQITEPPSGMHTTLQYLPCATEADRNCRENRLVQHSANSRPIVYVTFQQNQYSGASFSHPIATRRNQTVPYICNRVGNRIQLLWYSVSHPSERSHRGCAKIEERHE